MTKIIMKMSVIDTSNKEHHKKIYEELEKLETNNIFVQFITNNWDVDVKIEPTSNETISNLEVLDKKNVCDCNDKCPICQDKYSDKIIKLKCNHNFCKECITGWLKKSKKCPICRTPTEN